MTWTGQSFSVGQILTAAQMTNLQADITAQANGDSGAPKQQTAGIADDSVTLAKTDDTLVAGTADYILREVYEVTTTLGGYTKMLEITILSSGTIRSALLLKATSGGTAFARVYKNDVALGAEHTTTSTTYVTKTDTSLSVTKGDRIQLYIKVTGGTSPSVFADDWFLTVDNGMGSHAVLRSV